MFNVSYKMRPTGDVGNLQNQAILMGGFHQQNKAAKNGGRPRIIDERNKF